MAPQQKENVQTVVDLYNQNKSTYDNDTRSITSPQRMTRCHFCDDHFQQHQDGNSSTRQSTWHSWRNQNYQNLEVISSTFDLQHWKMLRNSLSTFFKETNTHQHTMPRVIM